MFTVSHNPSSINLVQKIDARVLEPNYLNRMANTGCSLNIVFFSPRILESLPPLPRHRSAAIGCLKNYQPIGVTVHSHCYVGEEGVAMN